MSRPRAYDVEIIVRWGTTVLHVSDRPGPRAFAIGEEAGCDCHVPKEALGGRTRVECVVAFGDAVAVPVPGWAPTSSARPFRDGCVAELVPLAPSERARIEIESLVIEIATTPAEPRARSSARSRVRLDRVAACILGLSLFAHVGVVAAGAHTMPAMRADLGEEPALAGAQILFTQKTLDFASEDVFDDDEEHMCPHHPPGTRGTPGAKERGRYAIAGPADNPDPHLARDRPIVDAAPEEAPIGLADPASGDTKAYTVPWGREDVRANDTSSARGRVWGDRIEDSPGEAFDVSPRHRTPPEEEDEPGPAAGGDDESQRPLGCVLVEP